MKRNKFMAGLLVGALTLALVGCGTSTTATGSTQAKAQASEEVSAETEKVTMPQERPVLIGKVKEIVGNEVTILKAEINEKQGPPSGERPAQGTQAKETQAQESNNSSSQATSQDKTAPGGGPRGFQMKFTEETETLQIPVGVPIVTMQRGSQEATVVGLTEIKKDTVLRIWKTDGEISFVQVTSGSGIQRGNRQNTGNNPPGGPSGMGGPPPGM